MTIALTGALVDTGPATPAALAPRVQASLLSALGRADPAAAMRLQLPSAVAAPASLMRAPAQATPAPKTASRSASSLLAAQLLGQDGFSSASDVEIFTLRANAAQTLPAPTQGEDDLASPRIAGGQVASDENPQTAASNNRETLMEKTLREAFATARTAPMDNATRSGIVALTSGVPALAVPLLRRVSMASIKGVGAYGFALARNATLRAPTEPAS